MRAADLVLGTMHFGTTTGEATAFAILDRFVQAGGRTIDSANAYAFWASPTGAGGQSEEVLGRWLAANPGVREGLTLATKVGVEPREPHLFEPPWEGLSGAAVRRACERSTERLGTGIDVYFAHGEDRAVDLAETVAAFGALVAEGTVGRFGFSNHPVWRVERARALAAEQGVAAPSVLQLAASYVRPRPGTPGPYHRFGRVTEETLDYVVEHPQLELWGYSPLLQGSYVRADRALPQGYDHPGTTQRLAVLGEVAAELGATPAQVVLAWLLTGEPPIRPIIGVSSVEQLADLLPATDLALSPPQRERLDAAR